MLSRHQGERVHLGQGRRLPAIVGAPEVVDGMAVLPDGRPTRHDVGVALHQCVGVLALHPIQERGVAIEVVEVFQQPEAEALGDVRVRLHLGEAGGHLDRDLLVADGGLERRLIRGIEPVHQRLLVMLDPADPGQRLLQLRVHPRAGVAETQGLGLDAVHQDHPHARERVVGELPVGQLHQVLPREFLSIDRRASFLQQFDCHGISSPAPRGRHCLG